MVLEPHSRFRNGMSSSRIGLAILAVLTLLAPKTRDQEIPGGSKVLVTAVPYASGSIPQNLQPQVGRWMADHFAYMIDGGLNVFPYLAQSVWAKYVDSAFIYADQVYAFNHEFAAAAGFPNPEGLFLHINRDYTVPAQLAWQHLDQFDFFEQPAYLTNGPGAPSQAVNGAFVVNGTNFTDVTGAIYDGAHTVAVANTLLLGYAEPFDLVNVTISTPRQGGALRWQYWNGNWTNLTPRTDTTSGFTASGSLQFTPPADWIPRTVNNSRSKYWIQAVVSGAGTNPAVTKVSGDDWASHAGTNNVRGWSASDPNRVNVGLRNLEYNPTPPPDATARFAYQGRATGLWAANAMLGNPSDSQNGKLTWAAMLLSVWQQNAAGANLKHNGALFDDGGSQPQITNPALPIEQLSDLRSGTWASNIMAMFQFLRGQMRSANGSDFKVGANISDDNVALQLDFSVEELTGSYPRIGNMPTAEMDLFLTPNNPVGAVRSFSLWDNRHFGITEASYFSLADGGNRTPMALLAVYEITGNPHTALQYNTFGWTYMDTDEYYYWAPVTATLAAPVAADPSNAAKPLVLDDDSQISLPGGPIWRNASIANSSDQAANIYGYAFRIGNDVIQPFKDSTNRWHTFTPILSNYPAGTAVQFARMGHQATDPVPSAKNVFYWANHFPAMDVDLGPPDPNGWNHGARDLAYIAQPRSSGNPAKCVGPYDCPEFWRRDFTNAIVIAHVFHDGNKPTELDVYGPATPISLGATYFPLLADGSTGGAITQLQLRAGEAAILMKSPISLPAPRPPAQRQSAR